jgi:hypothetical protein
MLVLTPTSFPVPKNETEVLASWNRDEDFVHSKCMGTGLYISKSQVFDGILVEFRYGKGQRKSFQHLNSK